MKRKGVHFIPKPYDYIILYTLLTLIKINVLYQKGKIYLKLYYYRKVTSTMYQNILYVLIFLKTV